jgi:fatty acid desaturase
MSAVPVALEEEPSDVPPPTDNGRVPETLIPALQRASASLRWRLLIVIGMWLAYLMVLPRLVMSYGAVAFALVPTVGVYLFCWLGYYRHELWHNYFPGIDNPRWFDLVSWLLFSDPAVYRLAHPAHHKYIHTTADIEFFCEGYEEDRPRRRRQFAMELVVGNMAWELTCLHRLFRDGKYTKWKSRICALKRAALFLALVSISRVITPGSGWIYLQGYLATLWVGSLVTRHNQWLEHLGICANGASLAERNLMTRNLPSDGPLAWLFNFVNHNDATEHVFHHTEPKLNTRGFPGLQLPPGARTVTIAQYLGILVDHYRRL